MLRRSVHHLLRRAAASAAASDGFSSAYSRVAGSSTASAPVRGATSLLTVALGGSLLAYSISAGEAARAEAPAAPPATASTTTPSANDKEEEDPYRIPTTTRGMPYSVVLYQYEVCPFCCKVKAFLDYHKVPYRVIEVNPLTKTELKWSTYKKVPVVLLDGTEQVNNSASIISRLAAELDAESEPKSIIPWPFSKQKRTSSAGGGGSGAPADEVAKWRRWVDERLVRVITVNIYRNASESFQTFDYITEHGNFGWVQREAARVVGATMMWSLSKRLKKKYNVEGDVREALYKCAGEWVEAVGDKPFLGGNKPSLADIEVFGVMRSVVGTDTFMDLQHNTKVGEWYERMMAAVGEPSRLPN